MLDATHLGGIFARVGFDRDGERLPRMPGVEAHGDRATRADTVDTACGALDVGRIDIAASHDDDVFDSTAHHDVAILHLITKVTSVIPAVLILSRNEPAHRDVARGQRLAAQLDHPNAAGRQHIAVLVDDADLQTVNKAVDGRRPLLAHGVERRELSHNVAASMRKVPRVRREMATYTPDEIGRVLRAADSDRNGHLWYLALSGLRRGEIAGLKWSDIDLEAGTLTVTRDRVQAGAGAVVENAPKTASSRRTLPLDQGLVAVLRHASARYAAERLALGSGHADSGYVAVNEAGLPYTPDTLTRIWRKLAKSAGVRVTGYTTRGTPAAPRCTCVVCRWR